MIHYGMDGVRVFCDYGYDSIKNIIQWTREAAEEHQTRVVFNIEIRCKYDQTCMTVTIGQKIPNYSLVRQKVTRKYF